MNHALPSASSFSTTSLWATHHDEAARLRRLRSLFVLFALYATTLFVVTLVSDGADVGCILAGISGHVFYATFRLVGAWREATWLDHARARVLAASNTY
jgi:hypothetical protein